MLKYLLLCCLSLTVVSVTSYSEEKPPVKKEAERPKVMGRITEISEKEIVLWVSMGDGKIGISYGMHIPLTKDTKYYLEEIESTGKKDDKGNEITKTTRKEITWKDLKQDGAAVIQDDKGNALSITQTRDKRSAPKGKEPMLVKPVEEPKP